MQIFPFHRHGDPLHFCRHHSRRPHAPPQKTHRLLQWLKLRPAQAFGRWSGFRRSRRSRLSAIKHSKPQNLMPHSIPAMLIRLDFPCCTTLWRFGAVLDCSAVSAPNASQINTDMLLSWGKQVLASRWDLETRSGNPEFQPSQDKNKSSAAQKNNNNNNNTWLLSSIICLELAFNQRSFSLCHVTPISAPDRYRTYVVVPTGTKNCQIVSLFLRSSGRMGINCSCCRNIFLLPRRKASW